MDYLDSQLNDKAYRQGYELGIKDLPCHEADWEQKYRNAYLNGYSKGRHDRLADEDRFERRRQRRQNPKPGS